MPDRTLCRSCNAPILWVVMASTKRRMPLDAEPHTDGTIEIQPDGTAGWLKGDVLELAHAPDPEGSRMKTIPLRVSLSGVCRSAADSIEKLARLVRRRSGWTPDSTDDDPAIDLIGDVSLLRMIEAHAHGVHTGLHTLEDFASFYCLTPKRKEHP